MLFNPVQATQQAHHMQHNILPEGTKAHFLSVGNALGYGGQVFSDYKAFAIHLPFNCSSTWIHLFLATPKYLMALAPPTGTQPSLTMTSFFVFLPTLPMHCFFRAHEARYDWQHFREILVCSHSKQGKSKVVVFISRDGPLVSNSIGKDTPARANEIHYLQPAALYPPFRTRIP